MCDQTSSIHRSGDTKWSNIKIERDDYQEMLIHLVLPNIKKKMAKECQQHHAATRW
jgi:hypothetical protein